MPDEYYDIDQFVDALNFCVERSRTKEMKCCICSVVTGGRGIGITADPPARPAIFAICDVCQVQPEWQGEASGILGFHIERLIRDEQNSEG